MTEGKLSYYSLIAFLISYKKPTFCFYYAIQTKAWAVQKNMGVVMI